MKICAKCHLTLAVTEFHKCKARADGLQRWCKACVKLRDAGRTRPYNPEKQRRHAAKRTEAQRQRRAIPEVHAALLEYNRAHYKKNKEAYFARAVARASRMRVSSIIHDDPKNVARVYAKAAEMRAAGLDVEVDHIVPLRGKTVSGLHVSWNLQIIPSAENRRKGNK